MGREEWFYHQHRRCCRRELDGHPVTVTTKQGVTTWTGKDYPMTKTRWKGYHLLMVGDEECYVDESMIWDSGPKLGVTLASTPHRDVPFTQEEIEEGRRRVKAVATECLIRAGIW